MNLSVGIVGLPNVGKSTLFNALLKKQQALAANYPFATIEPNVGIVPVPDERLDKLAEIEKEELKLPELPPKVPATVKFVDIAGLVKGASEGAGLGNKFLSHIREVNVIAHVVRTFEDPDVIKEGSVNPISDYETVMTELVLADLQTIGKINDKELKVDSEKKEVVENVENALNQGYPVHQMELDKEEREHIADLYLLSAKPQVIVLNVSENDYTEEKIPQIIQKYSSLIKLPPEQFIVVSAKIESELSALTYDDQKEYMEELGVKKSGLEIMIKRAYKMLGLISFLTAGEKEVRAWTIEKGTNAQMAAGVIHTDFIQHFIRAEIVPYYDFIENGGWKGSRDSGRARMEGRDYIMMEGDIVEFKIGR